MTTSALTAICFASPLPSSVCKLIEILLLPEFDTLYGAALFNPLTSSAKGCEVRLSNGLWRLSTWITSAPSAANHLAAYGIAINCPKSTTLIPLNGKRAFRSSESSSDILLLLSFDSVFPLEI